MSENRDATEAVPSDGSGTDLDEFFDVLADQHRRYALYYLLGRDDGAPLAQVVREVLEREQGCDIDVLRDERCRRVYLEFYHDHVPRMEASGLVDFVEDEGVVRPTAAINGYADLLKRARRDDSVAVDGATRDRPPTSRNGEDRTSRGQSASDLEPDGF